MGWRSARIWAVHVPVPDHGRDPEPVPVPDDTAQHHPADHPLATIVIAVEQVYGQDDSVPTPVANDDTVAQSTIPTTLLDRRLQPTSAGNLGKRCLNAESLFIINQPK